MSMNQPKQQCNTKVDNSELAASQKAKKKELKAHLKFQRKVNKLETRIAHAISRRDPVVEQQARRDLEELLRSKADTNYRSCAFGSTTVLSTTMDGRQSLALEEVTQIFRQLLSSLDRQTKQLTQNGSVKQSQNAKARNLLQHMTKGTQDIDMFKDVIALRGYVRKKFHGRAALIIKSLGELTPEALQMAPRVEDVNEAYRLQYKRQRELMNMCYTRLATIERACSIGCGPGNDVVGLITFLRALVPAETESVSRANIVHQESVQHKLKHVMLLDFAIDNWKDAALNELIPILQPQYVDQVTCMSCDVSKPLLAPSDANQAVNNENIADYVRCNDIFLTSYLLSETKNSWDLFFVQLVQLAPVGALFYFSEPMAWQLHRLIRMSTPCLTDDAGRTEKQTQVEDLAPLHRLNYIWIDSSMHYPELQHLDGRAGGPAVLLAIKL